MSSSTTKQFDMLAFIHGLRERGVKEDLAEYQARQLAQVIDIATAMSRKEVHSQELSTKTDLKQLEVALQADIKQLEFDLKTDIKQLEVDLKIDIKQLEVDLKTDIKQLEVGIKQLEVDLKTQMKQFEVKLEQYRYDSLKFIVWTGIGVVVFLGGMLVKGFHWLA